MYLYLYIYISINTHIYIYAYIYIYTRRPIYIDTLLVVDPDEHTRSERVVHVKMNAPELGGGVVLVLKLVLGEEARRG